MKFDGFSMFVLTAAAVIAFLFAAFRRRPNRCPKCRELNRELARYCAQCGTKLPER